MEDSNHSNHSLFILITSIFAVIAVMALLAMFPGSYSFCSKFCVVYRYRFCCCGCTLDLEGYRRERESLRRLRELRRIHLLRQRLALQTYSQIPGPVPHSHSPPMSELSAHWTAFGFVFVPRTDMSSAQFRDQLTAEQRRTILEQLLVCQEYHAGVQQNWTATAATKTATTCNIKLDGEEDDGPEIEGSTPTPESLTPPSQSPTIAVPSHEEPDGAACAICLDPFQDGEPINSQASCPHMFHKDCLLEWLDKHDICPCCRRCMVSDAEWRQAAVTSGMSMTFPISIHLAHHHHQQHPLRPILITEAVTADARV